MCVCVRARACNQNRATNVCAFVALSYAGKRTGLINTEDPLALLQTLEVLEVCEDFFVALSPSMRMPAGEEKLAARKQFHEGAMKRICTLLNKRLEANKANGPFFVGPSLSVADLKAVNLYEAVTSGRLDGIPITALDEFPFVVANAKATLAVVTPLRNK